MVSNKLAHIKVDKRRSALNNLRRIRFALHMDRKTAREAGKREFPSNRRNEFQAGRADAYSSILSKIDDLIDQMEC